MPSSCAPVELLNIGKKRSRQTRDLLLAVMLGDGYLSPGGYGAILHSEKQKSYLEWKVKLLRKSGICCSDVTFKQNGQYPAFLSRLGVTPWSRLLYRVLYPNGKKNIFRRKLLNRLSPLHLAIWYMDDGGLSQKKRNGVVVANELFMNTHSSLENSQVLIDYFWECHGVRFTKVRNKGHFRLRCGTKEARKFLEIVSPYVKQVPSMTHKLAIKSETTSFRDQKVAERE